MKNHLLLLFLLTISQLSAQDPHAPKGSATVQIVPTNNLQANIKQARTNIQDLSTWIDNYEFELVEGSKTQGVSPGGNRSANLNMSKSNRSASENPIYHSRSALKSLASSLDALEKSNSEEKRNSLANVQKSHDELDKLLKDLYKSITDRGADYTSKAAELKVKHDTVKNSINNIR